MPWLSWTIHQIPLWLPDRWTALDDCLLEIDAKIREHNRQLPPRDFDVNRIAWTPWRTQVWLWRREWVVLRGGLTYRDRDPQVIAAAVGERAVRNFTYDGEHVRHASGECWYGVEVIAAEALTRLAPAKPGIGNAETLAPAPAAPDNSDPWPWLNELRLPGVGKVEAPATPPDPRDAAPVAPRRGGRPSQKEQIVAAFNALPDDVVRTAADLAALFDPVRKLIPGSRNDRYLPQKGYGDKTLRRHLQTLFDARRGTKPGTKSQ